MTCPENNKYRKNSDGLHPAIMLTTGWNFYINVRKDQQPIFEKNKKYGWPSYYYPISSKGEEVAHFWSLSPAKKLH